MLPFSFRNASCSSLFCLIAIALTYLNILKKKDTLSIKLLVKLAARKPMSIYPKMSNVPSVPWHQSRFLHIFSSVSVAEPGASPHFSATHVAHWWSSHVATSSLLYLYEVCHWWSCLEVFTGAFLNYTGVCLAKGKLTKSKYNPHFSGKVKTYFFFSATKFLSFITTTV